MIDEKAAYARIADRSLAAAETLLKQSHQESSAFYSYHAFESIGGALCNHLGIRYHPRSHPVKIRLFVSASKNVGLEHGVARASIIINSMDRNQCLYPNPAQGSSFTLPEDRLSVANAKDLKRRVGGVVKRVKKQVGI